MRQSTVFSSYRSRSCSLPVVTEVTVDVVVETPRRLVLAEQMLDANNRAPATRKVEAGVHFMLSVVVGRQRVKKVKSSQFFGRLFGCGSSIL
jgi:hypothetical protein